MIEARGDIVEFPVPPSLTREREAARNYHDRRYVFLTRDELEQVARMFFWAGLVVAELSEDEQIDSFMRMIYDADSRDWLVDPE